MPGVFSLSPFCTLPKALSGPPKSCIGYRDSQLSLRVREHFLIKNKN